MPSPVRDQLQHALGTSYTLGRELGGGGMSYVFVATESSLGRDVVIKTIDPELLHGASAERFTLEVKLAARLQQANIVPLLSAGDANGVPFYTMPFVKGLSLRSRMQEGPVPVGEATHILRDIAKALAYAHEQGIVHRDIKPENVLLSSGTAMVTDFGIAKALNATRTQGSEYGAAANGITAVGSSIGTPAYMAPEQAVGAVVDNRTDIYAWGVMAYELLTGQHPFANAGSPQKLIAAHIAQAPAPLRALNATVPDAVSATVMRALEKDPDKRPASAGELLAALDSASTPAANVPDSDRHGSGGRRLGVVLGALCVLAIVIGGWFALSRRSSTSVAAAPGNEHSIAVLPFESFGGDTANAYFGEGMADELTTELSHMTGLRIAGRASSARFKAQNASAQEIGAALNVKTVLDGTVRRAGDRIRVSAELTDASTGKIIWKDQYEREVKDVFAVQDDITRAIVNALQVELAGGASSGAIGAHGTTNLEAYDLYLRGLQLYRKRGASLKDAESYLTHAIALDPQFARAHATLASVLLVEPYYYNDITMGQVLPRARAAAERAVALDDNLAEAHLSLGHAETEAFEWAAAEKELRRGVSLNPQSAEGLFRLGFMLLEAGRAHEAVAAFEQAKAVDPFYPVSSAYLAMSLAEVGRDSEANAQALRALDLDSLSESVSSIVTNTFEFSGHCKEVIPFARKRIAMTSVVRRWALHASSLGACGDTVDARAVLNRIEAVPKGTWGRPSALAYMYLALGDTARGLDYMEEAAKGDGDLLLAQTVGSPRYDSVRKSPRFAALMKHFNVDLSRATAPDGGRSR